MAQGIYRESTNPKNQIESPHRHVPPPFRGLLLLRGGRRRRRLVSVSSAPVAVGAVHRGPLEEHEIVPAGSGPRRGGAPRAAAAAAAATGTQSLRHFLTGPVNVVVVP